jgi:catechol 2,3-dioxygenase-like lactoylglutathione lyase family enzyme
MPINIGNRVLPCLLVSDIRRSLRFYTETLGFTQTGYYPIESEPTRTEVRRDGVAIILYSDALHIPDAVPKFTGGLYIFPEGVLKLAEELRGKIPFAWGPQETEYGMHEFAIRDPDRYLLMFAERIQT